MRPFLLSNTTDLPRHSRSQPALDSEAGFTLIEVLVSALIVALIAAAVATSLVGGAHFSADQHRRADADVIAQQDQERLRGLSTEQLNDLNQGYAKTFDNTPFAVTSQAWFLGDSGGATCSGAGAAAYFKTISTVKWNGQTLASEESVIAPPAGGTLLTRVTDQNNAPLAGVNVAASGPDTAAGTTNANGCAIFSGIATGAYSLTLTDPGYTDPNGDLSPIAETATVTSTGTAIPDAGNPIWLGQSGTVNASFVVNYLDTNGSPKQSSVNAYSLSWYGGGAALQMTDQNTTGPLSTAASSISTSASSTPGVFPFAFAGSSYTNNYQFWAGKCWQEQPPAGYDQVSISPGATRNLQPGDSNNPPLQVPALYVALTYGGVAKQPTDVKVTFQSTSGTSCTDTWMQSPTTPPAGQHGYVYAAPFASSSSSSPASASNYSGTVSVCADYNASGTYYYGSGTSGGVTQFTDSMQPTATPSVAVTAATRGKC